MPKSATTVERVDTETEPKHFGSIEEFKQAYFPKAFEREVQQKNVASAIGEQIAKQSESIVQAAFAAL